MSDDELVVLRRHPAEVDGAEESTIGRVRRVSTDNPLHVLHRGSLRPPTALVDLTLGSLVGFWVIKNEKGQDQAQDLALLSRDSAVAPLVDG